MEKPNKKGRDKKFPKEEYGPDYSDYLKKDKELLNNHPKKPPKK